MEAVQVLKNEGWTIAALEITDESIPIQSVKRSHFPLALVIGNEVTGVDDRVLAAADMVLEIPQFGEKSRSMSPLLLGSQFTCWWKNFARLRKKLATLARLVK